MKSFEIPVYYKSSLIQKIKSIRKERDHYKKDFTPTVLDFGPVRFFLARHFGFCYGVENAIEIAYRTIEEHKNKNIYLLSEMIHNQGVNNDLKENGVKFIFDTYGNQLIDWDQISSDDILIIPAFGTTLETEKVIRDKNLNTLMYNTTCPFVEKVWKKSYSLGKDNFTVIIHGKAKHEETRATFSHAKEKAQSVIVRDIEEAKILGDIIKGKIEPEKFYEFFRGKHSNNFEVEKDLIKVGVVNQTTMLASETQNIADYIRKTMVEKYGEENIKQHFADTRDTLCYATNDNQQATLELLKEDVNFAIVVGGYNSSNTSHLVELLEQKFPTYLISDQYKISDDNSIKHFNKRLRKEITTKSFLPDDNNVNIIVTSGASCPDSVVEAVIKKILLKFDSVKPIETVLSEI